MHQHFLARIRQDTSDQLPWLVYADWLDEQDDATGSFVRLSMTLTEGQVELERLTPLLTEYEKLWPVAHPETRELLAEYRSALPTRFRVLDTFNIGQNPPVEMFAYARTIAVGYLESGGLRPGANLGVGFHSDGRPRRLQGIEVFLRTVPELTAGREPIKAALMWMRHLAIRVGTVLTPANPSE